MDYDRPKMISSPGVLRAELPNSLLRELDEGWGDDRDEREDELWRTAARRGFHPAFDTGVKRLILVVADGGGEFQDEDYDDGRTKISPSLVELWDALTPCHAKKTLFFKCGRSAAMH